MGEYVEIETHLPSGQECTIEADVGPVPAAPGLGDPDHREPPQERSIEIMEVQIGGEHLKTDGLYVKSGEVYMSLDQYVYETVEDYISDQGI